MSAAGLKPVGKGPDIFILGQEPVKGGTKVTQREEYRGIAVWFWDADWVEPAYQKANQALRDRVLQKMNE